MMEKLRTWPMHVFFKHYTPYSTHMSPENIHKLMGFYMEVILGIIL